MRRFFVVLAVVALLGIGEVRGAGVVAQPPGKTVGRTPGVTVARRPTNRHLKLAAPKAKAVVRPATPAVGSTRTVIVRRRHANATHRFAGHVVGVVRNGRGGYVAGASVRLAKAGGRPIRNPRLRHSTRTDSAGTYSMRSVRSGSYRVVASKKGLGKGYSGLGIRSGGVHRVDVRLGGGKKKRKG
jgi:hypothetical protein